MEDLENFENLETLENWAACGPDAGAGPAGDGAVLEQVQVVPRTLELLTFRVGPGAGAEELGCLWS